MHLLIHTPGILGLVSQPRIPSRGIMRSLHQKAVSPCFLLLYLSPHAYFYHAMHAFKAFNTNTLSVVFSAPYSPSVFAGSVFHVLYFFCCQTTACHSLPPITCWLAHLMPTLLMLLLAYFSHTLSTVACWLAMSPGTAHSLLFPQQPGGLLLLNGAYDARLGSIHVIHYSTHSLPYKEIRKVCMYPVKIKVLHLCC